LLSDCVANRIPALQNFPANPRTWLKYQQWVSEGVVSDYVSLLHSRGDNVWPMTNVSSDQEKRRAHIVLGQHLKQIQRARIVWTIIECEGNLL
jgi:hypothetical protein